VRLPLPGTILCLHGIWTPDEPSAGAANISIARLNEALDRLTLLTRVVPLTDLLQRIEQGRSTIGLSAITFDDAYLSVRDLALPLLERYHAPACVFAVSGAAETGARYWWDRIEDLHPKTPPERWRRLEDDVGLPQAYRSGQPADLGPLRPLRQWILAEHRGRVPSALADELTRLEDETGWRSPQRSMTMDELRKLSDHELMSMGVHTHTHAALALLPDAEVRQEIDTCYTRLRDAGIPVLPILAAPFGLVDPRTARVAAESGMRSTLLVSARSLWGTVAPSALPRMMMSEPRSGWRLLLNLTGAADAGRTLLGRRSPLAPLLPSPTT
jgi:peptidoglycan/xylan/chitin deacetylase (PgdA/CDA1 family)